MFFFMSLWKLTIQMSIRGVYCLSSFFLNFIPLSHPSPFPFPPFISISLSLLASSLVCLPLSFPSHPFSFLLPDFLFPSFLPFSFSPLLLLKAYPNVLKYWIIYTPAVNLLKSFDKTWSLLELTVDPLHHFINLRFACEVYEWMWQQGNFNNLI